jgi:hypothetical protein
MNPGPRDDERCAPLRDQHICVRSGSLTSGDWTVVAARLEQLGAWTLTDPCNPPRLVTNADGSTSFARGILSDAGVLSIQRRIGSTVSSFNCSAPGIQREDDGRRANEIYRYLLEVTGFKRP